MVDLFIQDNLKSGLAQSLAELESFRLASVDRKDPILVFDLLNNFKTYIAADGKIIPSDDYYVHEYDAAVDATAVGTVPFRGPQIPAGAEIIGQSLIVETAATGATTLGIGTADGTGSTQTADIYAQAAVGAAYTAGKKATIPTIEDESTYIDVAAGFIPTLNIVGGAVTAGKIRLFTKVKVR